MRWRVFLILVCAGLLAAPLARAEVTLQQQYLNIYLKINEAESMERQKDYRGALADFKDCYEGLAKINRSDPSWETALVLHRMADCKAKIIELQPLADAQPMTQVPSPTPEAPNNTSPDSAEVSELNQELDAVKAELNVTKQNLQQANQQSDAYRTQLEAVNQQMAALKGSETADEKMAKLTEQNKELTDQLAADEKELDVFRDNPKSKLAQDEAQVKNLQDQLAASQEANKALQDTTDDAEAAARPGQRRSRSRKPETGRGWSGQRRVHAAQARERNHARHPHARTAGAGPPRHGQEAHRGGIR